MNVPLEQLRVEHEAEFIGLELMSLLERVARATALSYPPSYSDAGVWNDESVADALQGWVIERLLGRRDLTKLLLGATSTSALRAGLTRSFGQYLTNNHERSSATNLYQRTVKLLRSDDAFVMVGKSSKANEQLWTTASNPQSSPSTANLRTRLKVAAELSNAELNVVSWRTTALHSSPVLRTPALKRFLEHLLSRLGPLTPADIIDIMRRRFRLVEPESVELDEEINAPEPSPHDLAAREMIAKSVAARVGIEDARLLAALAAEADLKTTAELCGVSVQSVRAAYRRMEKLVADDAVEPSEVDDICGLILGCLHSESRNSV